MLAIAAALCFLLAVFDAPVGVNLIALGLAFLALALLVGDWPFAAVFTRRR
ncbi:MAG: hypothetical protein JWR58_5474 [Pseudonocardia sp.]|nr:hypothetical protein [Pseudonocardia sp.]